MAKLQTMADRSTIIAARGVVDFYYWKGIPVARAWPKKSTQPRKAGEIASSNAFSIAAKITGGEDQAISAAFKDWLGNEGHGVTWVDFQRAMARGNSWIRL